jgi:hypothetical protein
MRLLGKVISSPFLIWRDDKVVKVPADQIEVLESEAEYGPSKKRTNSDERTGGALL